MSPFPAIVISGMKRPIEPFHSTLLLTFTMSAAIALATSFFVDHRVTATLGAEVAGDCKVAQVQCIEVIL